MGRVQIFRGRMTRESSAYHEYLGGESAAAVMVVEEAAVGACSQRGSWDDWYRRLARVALPEAVGSTTWRCAVCQGQCEPIQRPTLAATAKATATLAQWCSTLVEGRALVAARALVTARALAALRAFVAARAFHALVAVWELHALVAARALALSRRGHVKKSPQRRLLQFQYRYLHALGFFPSIQSDFF